MTRSSIREGFRASPLALALSVAFAPTAHAAEEAAPQRKASDLDKVEVVGEQKPSNVKYTESLRDTPQTITVVNREAMEQQNLLGLRDVLSTLPGITFGAGEGGGGYGDSITLRGFNANSDITTDGVRDSAQYSRTDSFNLEAIELINGANSVFSGAGSVGGNINLVSKMAGTGDFTTVQAGAGTDAYGRLTVDSNTDFENGTALRINAMVHQNDVPGRDVETFERWGIAPSIAFGMGSGTRFTLNYFHQTDDNTPQYGVPYYTEYGGTLPGVDTENYYGYSNLDRQEIDVDMLTGVFEQDFGANATLRSLARYQVVDQLSVVSAPQGTWCLADNTNASPTATACLTGQAPGTFQPGNPGGPRGFSRDTKNAIAISQTDLTTRFATGTVNHALVAGVSFSHETFDLETVNTIPRAGTNTYPDVPPMSIAEPDHVYRGARVNNLQNQTEGSLDTAAAYVFDTLEFDQHWMLNLGARYERSEGDTVTDAYATSGANIGAYTGRTVGDNTDNLFSYRAAAIYKPVEAGTIYLSYANSKTPSKASVNGACTAQTCDVDPETGVTMELGTKWDLRPGLAVNAAVFRNDREEYKVADPGNPANPSGEQQLDGEARVDGVALGIAGQLTRDWALFANVTFLESEVLQGVSDNCLATPSVACGNATGPRDPLAGRPITGTPERAGNVWTTYDLERWTFGYGISYQSGYVYYTGLATAATLGDIKGYTTHRAMVAFDVNDALSLQLNVNNLFDKDYFIRVRNNGWATPGDARSLVLNATYRF